MYFVSIDNGSNPKFFGDDFSSAKKFFHDIVSIYPHCDICLFDVDCIKSHLGKGGK